jgi:hypothetical protein
MESTVSTREFQGIIINAVDYLYDRSIALHKIRPLPIDYQRYADIVVNMSTALLSRFAEAVNAAIAQVPESGRFGNRKVFVSAIWDAITPPEYAGLSMDDFKRHLIAAQRAQLLSLARADLVAAMPGTAVAASEIMHNGASYHFVIDAHSREAWA